MYKECCENKLDKKCITYHEETEQFLNGPNGTLQTFFYGSHNENSSNVLVLPNGYGMLRYTKTVCLELANIGCSVFAMNFSGQGKSDGELSLDVMTEDACFGIKTARQHFDSSSGTIILAHCTAMLPLLELNKKGFDWKGVDLIILYGYLARPVEHFTRFIRKGKKYDVRINQIPENLPCYGPEDYAAIPVPLVVIHPRIPNNIHRSSVSDVTKFVEIAKPKAFYVPDFGYAISDHLQSVKVRQIISSFISPYISVDSQANLIQMSLETIQSQEA